MKKIIVICWILIIATNASAQLEKPVTWSYAAKRISPSIIEVQLRAKIDKGWHIYAQKQPEDAVAVATNIVFTKQAGIELLGIPLEKGKKEIYAVKSAGITNHEYSGEVTFVQKIKVRPGLKEVKGSILFQACTHEKCLPEETIKFTVPLLKM